MHSPQAHRAPCCAGGWLYQDADSLKPEEIEFTSVSDTKPTEQQLEDLKFAWRIVKHVKSNAITVAKDGRLLGMGSGQPNRVKSTEIALEKAAEEAKVRLHHSVLSHIHSLVRCQTCLPSDMCVGPGCACILLFRIHCLPREHQDGKAVFSTPFDRPDACSSLGLGLASRRCT